MPRRIHRFVFPILFVVLASSFTLGQSLPEPTAEKLPRWRGFNLLEKFHRDWSNGPYRESDFKIVSEFGFNFVRLPLDYRVWIEGNDWNRFDQRVLGEIDQAVAWGQKYSVHVCLNFHRAPGYTVASPAEATSLWTDEETQTVCAKHWAEFARRYQGIPNANLSFNLFNEPSHIDKDVYVAVVKKMAAAIRAEDPNRLIISDGLQWGQEPLPEIAAMGIAQATRGYTPIEITHYRANWMNGSDRWPIPSWPRVTADATLYSPSKSELPADVRRPLQITSDFQGDTQLRFRIGTVSGKTSLGIMADGKTIRSQTFDPKPDSDQWVSVKYIPQWQTYQGVYAHNETVTIPAGTKMIEFVATDGDWMTLSEITITQNLTKGHSHETKLAFRNQWGEPPSKLRFVVNSDPNGHSTASFRGGMEQDRQWLFEQSLAPWRAAQKSGMGVMVGEFGCHNQTPHDVTLAWMEDNLANWQQADMGWALWNLRGSFGVLDSDRKDVKYENYQGHKLDRKMLKLLQKY